MQTYIIYISALLLIMLCAHRAQNTQKKVYVWLIILILSFVAGCRSFDVGKDTESYIGIFQRLEDKMWDLVYCEIGFKWLSYIFLKIFDNYTAVLLIYAFFTNLLIVFRLWDFRNTASFILMVACYYISFYFMTMNIMRQFFATSIVFYSTKYIEQKKYLRFLCCIGVATLFHTSSLAGVAFIGLDAFQWYYLNHKQKFFIGAAILTLPLVFPYIYEALIGYEHYFDAASGEGIGLMLVAKLILYVLGILLFDRQICNSGVENDEYKMRCVRVYYLLGIMLTGVGYFYLYMDRMGLPFYLFECIFFGILVKRTTEKIFFKMILLVLLLYIFGNDLTNNGQGVLPYEFFWQT